MNDDGNDTYQSRESRRTKVMIKPPLGLSINLGMMDDKFSPHLSPFITPISSRVSNISKSSPLPAMLEKVSSTFRKGNVEVFHVPGSSIPTSVIISSNGEKVYFPGDITKEVDNIYDFGGSPKSTSVFSPKNFALHDIYELIIRPMENEWIMGDDWHIKVHRDMKIKQIRCIIEENKHIPSSRQILSHLRHSTRIDIPSEEWSLRRLGFTVGDVIIVEPTMPNTWLWSDMEYYENKLIENILKEIDKFDGSILLCQLSTIFTPLPPPIKMSILVFIRKFPDKFFVYTDTVRNLYWIQRPSNTYQIPVFNNLPMELGQTKPLVVPTFDFDAYADIDDTKPLELDFVIPNISYNIQILSVNNINPSIDHNYPNPICIIYFNHIEIGRTNRISKTMNPKWNHAIFSIEVTPNQNIFDCVLTVQVCDDVVSEDEKENNQNNDSNNDIDDSINNKNMILGCIELKEIHLIEFISGLYQETFTFDLKQPIYNGISDQSCGTITMKGGKLGFEVSIQSAYGLANIPDPQSRVFSIILWNGSEIGRTFTESRRLQNPVWNETFTIPTNNFDPTLSEDYLEKISDCVLEIQVWSTEPNNTDEKEDFLGSVILKNENLVETLTKTWPYAIIKRTSLQKSMNISISRKRNHRIQGTICYAIGAAGLNIKRCQPLEITIVSIENVTKFKQCFYTIEWNYNLVHRSNHVPLILSERYASAIIGQKCLLEMDQEEYNLSNYYIKIEIFESIPVKGYSTYGEYMGCVYLQGQELLQPLFLSDYATIGSYPLHKNDTIDSKRQTLINGELILRGGKIGSRTESERILIIYGCRDLIMEKYSITNAYVVISYLGKEIGRTSIIRDSHHPLWDSENIFFIPLESHNHSGNNSNDSNMNNVNNNASNGGISTRISATSAVLVSIETSVDRTFPLPQLQSNDFEVEVCHTIDDSDKKIVIGSVKIDNTTMSQLLQSTEPIEKSFYLKAQSRLRLAHGKEATIRMGTCGTKYSSIGQYRDNL